MFNISKATYGIVVLVVSVIIIASCVIPVVESSMKDFTSKENNEGEKYSVIQPTETITLSQVSNRPGINGEQLSTYYPDASSSTAMVISDAGIVFVTSGQNSWRVMSPALDDIESNKATFTNADSVVFENGVMTINITVSEVQKTYTANYKFLMALDPTGDYGAWNYAEYSPIFVDNDKELYIASANYTGNTMLVGHGKLSTIKADVALPATATNVTITLDYEAGGVSSELNTVSVSDNLWSGGRFIFAPIEYTVVDDAAKFSLLSIIPVVMLMIPVMLAVTMITPRRD